MKKIWNLDQLMADANAFDVADRIGMRKKRCGGAIYVECVDGSHTEHNINHNQLFRDGCHCYSCGANHNVYGMVRGYYNNILGSSISHDEICGIIAETCGGEDNYLLTPKAGVKHRPFPLTKEELELIGLSASSQRAQSIAAYSEYKDEEHPLSAGDGCGYIRTEPLPAMSIYSLYRDDESLFREIVRNKIREAYDSYRQIYYDFRTSADIFLLNYARSAFDCMTAVKNLAEKMAPSAKKEYAS